MTSTLIDAHLDWEVRVGVHAGPVVAGVVGQERYQFDIWGDTVNVAARMVGMSAPGSVAATKEIFAGRARRQRQRHDLRIRTQAEHIGSPTIKRGQCRLLAFLRSS
jgi:class 3 adenylate cyclase